MKSISPRQVGPSTTKCRKPNLWHSPLLGKKWLLTFLINSLTNNWVNLQSIHDFKFKITALPCNIWKYSLTIKTTWLWNHNNHCLEANGNRQNWTKLCQPIRITTQQTIFCIWNAHTWKHNLSQILIQGNVTLFHPVCCLLLFKTIAGKIRKETIWHSRLHFY